VYCGCTFKLLVRLIWKKCQTSIMWLKYDPLIILGEAYVVCVILSIALTHNANGSRKCFRFRDDVRGPWFRHEIDGAVAARSFDVYFRLSGTRVVHGHGTVGHCYRRRTLVGAQYLQYRGPEVVIHFRRTPFAIHLRTWQRVHIRINTHSTRIVIVL